MEEWEIQVMQTTVLQILSPDSWDIRFLLHAYGSLRGLRYNLGYIQPSYDYLWESTRGFGGK